jgi:hypothetical protein
MGRISSLPINNFQGTQTSPSVAVPAGATDVSIDFDGTTMLDPAVQVDTKIEFAPDGTTWRQSAARTSSAARSTAKATRAPSIRWARLFRPRTEAIVGYAGR